MAYSTIIKPSDYFDTKLYTGTGASNAITGVGFQPDFTWIKERAGAAHDHNLTDAVRGVTKTIRSNTAGVETTDAQDLKTFDSNGFTVGTNGGVNENNINFASWNWKGNGSGSANTDGTISSTVSANTTSGFSIVKYTGNSSSTSTIGHGLGVAPSLVMIKNLGQAEEWAVGANAGDLNFTQYAYLNLTNAFSTNAAAFFNNTNPSSSLIYIGNSGTVNGGASYEHIAYCFAEVKGYSKIGYYVGNQNADGPFLYTGFKPAFILSKKIDGASDWYIFDSKREGYNFDNDTLLANQTTAESTTDYLDILSNGYKVRTTDGDLNTNNGEYVYMAFAENPFVANVGESLPTTAR